MSFRNLRIISAIVLAFLMVAPVMAQTSTSGAIEGKVTDRSGAPLPGVTVGIHSPNLQGSQTDVSDANGRFRFGQLPPGVYSLNATLSGFSTMRQNNLQVGLGRTLTLEVTLSQAVSETIVVSGAAPVVDVTSITSGTNVTSQTMQSLPLGRNYIAAAQLAPGTNADATGVTVYGSSGAENQYIIDGLNTTDLQTGVQGKFLNFDFIQEIEVKTGGLPAEYGRMTGGTINAITKSGGNELKGDAFVFESPDSFHAGNKTFTKRSASTTTVVSERDQFDGGLDVGGYFVKDRLWFFGAYDRLNETDFNTRVNKDLVLPSFQFPVGASRTSKTKRDLYAGKLTLHIGQSQNLNVSVFGDPSTTSGVLFGISGPPSTFEGDFKTGGADFNARYNAVIATDYLLDADAGHHHQDSKYSGGGATIVRFYDVTVTPNIITGGFAPFDSDTFDRNVVKLDLSRYFTKHEVKVGADYEDMRANVNRFQAGGGQRIYEFVSKGVTYYRHRYYVNDLAPGFDPKDPNTWVIANPLVSKPKTKNYSVYAQDAWKMLSNFTLSAGVRWESQEVIGREDVTAFKLKKNWAPRLGFIWDPENSGRSKLYGNVGRFYESIPMDINIRSFGGELICFCYNFSPDPANIKPDPAAPRKSSVLGSGKEPVDPNLKAQHLEEYLVGYEREVAPDLAVGIKGTYRKLADVIEDMLVPSTGEYFIANPGKGIGREAGFYDGVTTGIAPTAKRTYKAVELDARRRFSNGYQFFASYVWSRLDGNYDGTFQVSTGQLDPNINSAFDYADFSVNNHGLLSNDRTHQLKFDGSYEFSNGPVTGLTLGLSTHYASGTPLTAYGYSFAYGNWEYYLTPRGALGRGPAEYEADINVGYPIQVGPARIKIVGAVFNALNLQRKIQLDSRYNLVEDQPCAGIPDAICNGDGGLLAKPGDITQPQQQLTNPRASATNPTFLKAGIAFTQPRTFRIGAKITF